MGHEIVPPTSLATVQCPTCDTNHLAGYGHRFSDLPSLTISDHLFRQFGDRARHLTVIQWLNRDKLMMDLRREADRCAAERRELLKRNADLLRQLETATEQRDLYYRLVQVLSPAPLSDP